MKKKLLISIATGWGPRHGGINSFNFDFLRSFKAAYLDVSVICIVPRGSAEEKQEAAQHGINLQNLPYEPVSELLDESMAKAVMAELSGELGSSEIVFLGHDVFTGGLANELAKLSNARSAVVHHMSFETYKSYEKGSSVKAQEKTKLQKKIFSDATLMFAVGPMLRDELNDWFNGRSCGMLIPGLPEIDPLPSPSKWTAILFGRLNPDTNRLKQTKLALAAAASCERDAKRDSGLAQKLKNGTRVRLFGVDEGDESCLRSYVEAEAEGVLDMHFLPYTEDRHELFDQLRRSSVALMPSWHEGFGLVGWEAIAAGVPIILGRDSGLFRFLSETFPGAGPGCVTALNIRGSHSDPFFQPDDLVQLTRALKEIAANEESARKSALVLKNLVGVYTGKRCAEDFVKHLGWDEPQGPKISASSVPAVVIASENEFHLTRIPRASWDAGKGHSQSQLLRADEACVPFVEGKQGTLIEIIEWVKYAGFPLEIRLYTGAGGSGKTRLLIEACQRISGMDGWNAGFLPPDVTVKEIRHHFSDEKSSAPNGLIVIDYAETRREQLAALVEYAQTLKLKKLRIILLARDAGEWWERLPTDYPTCERLFAGPATSGPYMLLPLHSDEASRVGAYEAALRAYAEKLGIKGIQPYLTVLPDLRPDHYGHPLYLQMAALLALHGEHADSATGLTEAILRHEYRYWRALAKAENVPGGEGMIAAMMTLSTLGGGLATEKEAWERLEDSHALLPDKPTFVRLFRALCPLYPGRQGLQPLKPDLLGEALIASAMTNRGADQLVDSALATNVLNSKKEHALSVLTRASRLRPVLEDFLQYSLHRHFVNTWQHILKVGRETGSPLIETACRAFGDLQTAAKIQIASPLLARLGNSSVIWDALALLAAHANAEYANLKLEKSSPPHRDGARMAYADALIKRAITRKNSGDFFGAENDAELSVNVLRKVKKSDIGELSTYCRSLNNAANRLNDISQYDKALTYAEEAHDVSSNLLRKTSTGEQSSTTLAKVRTPNSRAGISAKDRIHANIRGMHAGVLGTLSSCHGNLGNFATSLEMIEQAVEIMEDLSREDPQTHKPSLATLIMNIGVVYADNRRLEEFLEYAKRAASIYEELSEERPDQYTETYAQALTNVGAAYSMLGIRDESVRNNTLALELLRPLATKRPERFSQRLAAALQNAGSDYTEVSDFENAFACNAEATEIFEKLFAKHPAAFRADYFHSEMGIAYAKFDLGDYSSGSLSLQLSADLLEPLYLERPTLYAAEKLTTVCATAFYRWLINDIKLDVELASVEEECLRNVGPRDIIESRSRLLFSKGCLASSDSHADAVELFAEFLALMANAPIGDFRRFMSEMFVASKFCTDHGRTDALTSLERTAREKIMAFDIESLPAWAKLTLGKLS